MLLLLDDRDDQVDAAVDGLVPFLSETLRQGEIAVAIAPARRGFDHVDAIVLEPQQRTLLAAHLATQCTVSADARFPGAVAARGG